MIFDSSALIAYLRQEPGAHVVRDHLENGGQCSAANWAEVAQKVEEFGMTWVPLRSLLLSFKLVVEPVTMRDAESAARLWVRGTGLSLADRLCLALGERVGAEVLTCDKQWDGRPGVVLAR